jgi:hypothetical protein
MKHWFVLLPITLCLHSNAQDAAIFNTNLQIFASLNNSPMAWATDIVDVHVNTQTGEFVAHIVIDDLRLAIVNPDWAGSNGENKGKSFTLTGILPISDVINNNNSVVDLNVELTANFNNLSYQTPFTFTVLRMSANNNKGFSVMCRGSVSISKLQINNLKNFDDTLGISLSFTGY